MPPIHCEKCQDICPGYDIIHIGSFDSGYRKLCTRCYNEEAAERYGLVDFENIRFEPVGIDDCSGHRHEFQFRTRLMGHIVAIEAFELFNGNPGGYMLQQIGDPEEDLFALLGRLIQKIRSTLAVKHVETGLAGLQIIGTTVRGRIDADLDASDSIPLVVIDGREISWAAFGELLMSFEGWQFKLDLAEPSDEV